MSIVERLQQRQTALTASELAEILSTHKLTIYRLAAAGTIAHYRVGACLRFDPRSVVAYLRAHEIGAVRPKKPLRCAENGTSGNFNDLQPTMNGGRL